MELLSSLILHCDIRCLCVLESVLLVNNNCCLASWCILHHSEIIIQLVHAVMVMGDCSMVAHCAV